MPENRVYLSEVLEAAGRKGILLDMLTPCGQCGRTLDDTPSAEYRYVGVRTRTGKFFCSKQCGEALEVAEALDERPTAGFMDSKVKERFDDQGMRFYDHTMRINGVTAPFRK